MKGNTENVTVLPLHGVDRLSARLEVLIISDENFLYYVRQWRSLRLHRPQICDMASRYPLIVDFREVRLVLDSPEEVDRLIANLQAKLKAHWSHVLGTESFE